MDDLARQVQLRSSRAGTKSHAESRGVPPDVGARYPVKRTTTCPKDALEACTDCGKTPLGDWSRWQFPDGKDRKRPANI